MTTVAIHQPQYLPYLGFFHKILHCDLFIVLDDTQFQKNGVQNRNKIKTPTGWQWLTVPVRHNFGQAINQVKINSEIDWQRKHWHTLVTNYSNAPHFARYSAELEARLFAQKYHDLCSLNMELMNWAMRALGITTPVHFSSQLNVAGDKTEHLINLCRAVSADCYLSGSGGKLYMKMELFERAGIRVEFQQFVSPTYPQVFPQVGFIPDLSIVDVLFSCGSETSAFLK